MVERPGSAKLPDQKSPDTAQGKRNRRIARSSFPCRLVDRSIDQHRIESSLERSKPGSHSADLKSNGLRKWMADLEGNKSKTRNKKSR